MPGTLEPEALLFYLVSFIVWYLGWVVAVKKAGGEKVAYIWTLFAFLAFAAISWRLMSNCCN